MNEFKFDCPVCGQHILADSAWRGCHINCLSCNTRITVPAASKARPNSPGRVMRVRLPVKKNEVKVAQTGSKLQSRKRKAAAKKLALGSDEIHRT
jgi:hypothetical protein